MTWLASVFAFGCFLLGTMTQLAVDPSILGETKGFYLPSNGNSSERCHIVWDADDQIDLRDP